MVGRLYLPVGLAVTGGGAAVPEVGATVPAGGVAVPSGGAAVPAGGAAVPVGWEAVPGGGAAGRSGRRSCPLAVGPGAGDPPPPVCRHDHQGCTQSDLQI